MNGKITIYGPSYSREFEEKWKSLFSRVFIDKNYDPSKVFQKYTLNKSYIAIEEYNGKFVGAYGGLILDYDNDVIFLSTDTMSDGTLRSASVRLAKKIYEHLENKNIFVVCGFPNDKIMGLREKKLGWRKAGYLYGWIGIPLISTLHFNSDASKLWEVKRPGAYAFGNLPWYIALKGRGIVASKSYGMPFTMSTHRPGRFFVKIPNFLLKPKVFAYKILGNRQNITLEDKVIFAANNLDVSTIDLP